MSLRGQSGRRTGGTVGLVTGCQAQWDLAGLAELAWLTGWGAGASSGHGAPAAIHWRKSARIASGSLPVGGILEGPV